MPGLPFLRMSDLCLARLLFLDLCQAFLTVLDALEGLADDLFQVLRAGLERGFFLRAKCFHGCLCKKRDESRTHIKYDIFHAPYEY